LKHPFYIADDGNVDSDVFADLRRIYIYVDNLGIRSEACYLAANPLTWIFIWITCRYTCSRLRIESNPIQYGINGQLDQIIKRVVRRDGCRDERLKKESMGSAEFESAIFAV